jgi:RND family efflux transporter MFP subunit
MNRHLMGAGPMTKNVMGSAPRTPWLHAGVLLAALVLAQGCGNASGQAARTGRQAQGVPVETTPVQRISIQRTVDLAGNLMSPDQAKVSSEVAGVVRDVPVQLGQTVQRGQVLVHVEPRELELALERAESALKQTEAQLAMTSDTDAPPPDDQVSGVRTALANRDDARAQNARAEELSKQGLISAVDLEATRTKLKVTEAAYQAAIEGVRSLKASLQDRRASYLLAQKKVNDASIKAPVAGSVAERLVQPGEFIKEDTPVVTLVEMDPLKLVTAAQERYASAIHLDMPVEFSVESFPGEIFHGKIISVSPAVDQQTRTFTVEAGLPNPNYRLKPGFFAKGVILTHIDDKVLAVPEQAVSTLAGVSTVYIVDSGKVKPQQVTLGVRQNKLIEIVDGLKGNERLATTNLNQLAAGVPVVESKGDATNTAPGRGRGRGQP